MPPDNTYPGAFGRFCGKDGKKEVVKYDPNVLDDIAKDFKSMPAGCSIDIGVTRDGRTVLIEINDGFALGCYGADCIQYAKLLSARWCELVGIHDECDTYFEGADWKKRGVE